MHSHSPACYAENGLRCRVTGESRQHIEEAARKAAPEPPNTRYRDREGDIRHQNDNDRWVCGWGSGTARGYESLDDLRSHWGPLTPVPVENAPAPATAIREVWDRDGDRWTLDSTMREWVSPVTSATFATIRSLREALGPLTVNGPARDGGAPTPAPEAALDTTHVLAALRDRAEKLSTDIASARTELDNVRVAIEAIEALANG